MEIGSIKDKNCLVWIGDKNSFLGTSNSRTGLRSLHGCFKAFKNKKVRDHFLNNYRTAAYSSCISCTIRTGRKFSQGQSVAGYYESLYFLKCLDFDDLYQLYNF